MPELRHQGPAQKPESKNAPVAPEGHIYVLRRKSDKARVYKARSSIDAILAVSTVQEFVTFLTWYKAQAEKTQASMIRVLEATKNVPVAPTI